MHATNHEKIQPLSSFFGVQLYYMVKNFKLQG